LLAIGSILHFAQDDAVIWGAGVNGKIADERHRFTRLDVRAVRGPETRAFLAARGVTAPEVYGDPALLLPRVAPGRFEATRARGPVFVPNLHDVPLMLSQELCGLPFVTPTQCWSTCVTAILSHNLVLASSLHGLVVAEAYGIPARYVRLSETENLLKY